MASEPAHVGRHQAKADGAAPVVIAAPQPFSGFREQVLREALGAVRGAEFGLEHMLLAEREKGGWISTPCSIWWNSSPLMPPDTRRSRSGDAFQSSATVPMPARRSRSSLRLPMP